MNVNDPISNSERVERVRPFFDDYSERFGEETLDKQNMVDLVADLFHLCTELNIDPVAVTSSAMNHWTSEVEEKETASEKEEYPLEKRDLRALFKLHESVDSFDGFQELDEYESSTLLAALADPAYAKALSAAYESVEDKDIFYDDDDDDDDDESGD